MAGQSLAHLTQWAVERDYDVVEVVRETGLGTNGRREGLEKVRRLVRGGLVDAVIVERRDRLMLTGAAEFVRWAGENGVEVAEAGLGSEEARRTYAEEALEDVFYPLADVVALATGDRERAEQAAARAIGEIADFLDWA